MAQFTGKHADEPVILSSANVVSKFLPEFEAFRNSIREARNGQPSNLMEFRAALDRFASGDAREISDHGLHGSAPGYYILREEISRSIAGTRFEPSDLSSLNVSLAMLLDDGLGRIRTGKTTARTEFDHVDALISNNAGRAELVGLTLDEYSKLDPKDARIVEAVLAIYLRRFWSEFEKFQQA